LKDPVNPTDGLNGQVRGQRSATVWSSEVGLKYWGLERWSDSLPQC